MPFARSLARFGDVWFRSEPNVGRVPAPEGLRRDRTVLGAQDRPDVIVKGEDQCAEVVRVVLSGDLGGPSTPSIAGRRLSN